MTITGDFERFQYLNFENKFSENLKHFLKKLEFCFLAQNTTNRSTTFHIKLPCKMPMLKDKMNGKHKMDLSQRMFFRH